MGINTFPTKRPSLPGYSISGAEQTDTRFLVLSPIVASIPRKFGSCIQVMRRAGLYFLQSSLSLAIRLRLRLTRFPRRRSSRGRTGSMFTRSTLSERGYSSRPWSV